MGIKKKGKGNEVHHAMGDGICHNLLVDKYVSCADEVKTTLMRGLRKLHFKEHII